MNTSEIPQAGDYPVYVKLPWTDSLRRVKNWKITPVSLNSLDVPQEDEDNHRAKPALVLIADTNYDDND